MATILIKIFTYIGIFFLDFCSFAQFLESLLFVCYTVPQSHAFCYYLAMLQSRRVIDITNTICNYIFLVFLLLFSIYAVSLWRSLDANFIVYVVNITNTLGLTVSVLSIGLFLTSIVLLFIDHKLKVALFLTCLLRLIFSILIMVLMSTLSTLVANGFEVYL